MATVLVPLDSASVWVCVCVFVTLPTYLGTYFVRDHHKVSAH